MKDGIPYFPLDCELDSKFELIEAEFGLQGFAVVVKLLQRIYGGAKVTIVNGQKRLHCCSQSATARVAMPFLK